MRMETVIEASAVSTAVEPSNGSGWPIAITMTLGLLLAGYLAGWLGGVWSIRWEELLAELTVLTAGYWVVVKLVARREAKAGLTNSKRLSTNPWLKWPADSFLTLLAVLLIRAVTVEPFGIPSESMVPTLAIGDQVLVNKFSYGLKIPVLDVKVVNTGTPARGDVVVFRSPMDPKDDWIKRVVGVPGDKILYDKQHLYVNGKPETAEGQFPAGEHRQPAVDGEARHAIVVDPSIRTDYRDRKGTFPLSENCDMAEESMSCVVPRGHYFVMGDNRDHSEDSRKWGFVPEHNLVGRASVIWHSKTGTDTGFIK